jgi:hypothetical protein
MNGGVVLQNIFSRNIYKAILKTGTIVLMISLLVSNVSAYWSSSTIYGSQTAKISGTTQNQSSTITLPAGAIAYSAQTDNGSVTYSQSGTTVTVNLNGGSSSTSSSQVWNATKYSKYVTVTSGPQSSQSFPSTYSYNDGTYSGTINQSGSATLVSGLPSASKTATYDYYYRYNATATIISIIGSTIYFSWYYPSVDSYYYYSDAQGYSGNIAFTGYNNATYVDSHFDFASPNYVGETGQGYGIHIFHYSGTVIRPDTRQWTMNYNGTVYQGGYDTITTTTYTYNVTIYYYTTTTTWISDTTPPDGSATLSPSSITSGNVTINFTATDSGSGVKSITLPNGTIVNGATTTYTATDDGVYNFIVTDNDSNTKTIPITISNIDRTVTITHPISVDYTINPNNATPFSCPDITITNNSRINVQVSVQQLKATAGGSIVFNDVLPTKYSNWSKLTAAQTKSDIALGIKVKETATGINTWYSISNSSTLYAANITSKTALGILNPNGAIGNLSLSAYCGNAWNNAYTSKHNLTLIFDAY